jgi:hypothetical protein
MSGVTRAQERDPHDVRNPLGTNVRGNGSGHQREASVEAEEEQPRAIGEEEIVRGERVGRQPRGELRQRWGRCYPVTLGYVVGFGGSGKVRDGHCRGGLR